MCGKCYTKQIKTLISYTIYFIVYLNNSYSILLTRSFYILFYCNINSAPISFSVILLNFEISILFDPKKGWGPGSLEISISWGEFHGHRPPSILFYGEKYGGPIYIHFQNLFNSSVLLVNFKTLISMT